jgi:hypothetical protein
VAVSVAVALAVAVVPRVARVPVVGIPVVSAVVRPVPVVPVVVVLPVVAAVAVVVVLVVTIPDMPVGVVSVVLSVVVVAVPAGITSVTLVRVAGGMCMGLLVDNDWGRVYLNMLNNGMGSGDDLNNFLDCVDQRGRVGNDVLYVSLNGMSSLDDRGRESHLNGQGMVEGRCKRSKCLLLGEELRLSQLGKLGLSKLLVKLRLNKLLGKLGNGLGGVEGRLGKGNRGGLGVEGWQNGVDESVHVKVLGESAKVDVLDASGGGNTSVGKEGSSGSGDRAFVDDSADGLAVAKSDGAGAGTDEEALGNGGGRCYNGGQDIQGVHDVLLCVG